jgi:4-hydroxybenzoate polyprenyltransferase
MGIDLIQSKSKSDSLSFPLWPLIRLLRPREWIKNSFVAAPLIFSGLFHREEAVLQTGAAMLIFCLASSATYILNDLFDRFSDALHRQKLERPLVSGTVSTRQASALLGLVYIILLISLFWMPALTLPIGAYLALNAVYTFRLKQVPVVDLFCIAMGFVLRVYAGALALAVPLSIWMLTTTLCLALYLAAIKRLEEFRTNGVQGRKVLLHYSEDLLERYAQVTAVSTILFYGLFIITMRPQLEITLPLVLFGLFRYWYIIENKGGGESPSEILLKDSPLVITIFFWILLCLYSLSGSSPIYPIKAGNLHSDFSGVPNPTSRSDSNR